MGATYTLSFHSEDDHHDINHHLEWFPPYLLAYGSGSLNIDEKSFLWEELAASKYFFESTFVFCCDCRKYIFGAKTFLQEEAGKRQQEGDFSALAQIF